MLPTKLYSFFCWLARMSKLNAQNLLTYIWKHVQGSWCFHICIWLVCHSDSHLIWLVLGGSIHLSLWYGMRRNRKVTKACTHWKSNPGPQAWSTTALTTKQILLDNHQPTQSSIYTDPVVLNAVVSNLAATGYQGLLGVDWKLDLLSISPHTIEHVLQMRWGTLQCKKVYILVTSLAFLLCVWHVEFKEWFQFERA